jgi:hypothetical protein
MRNLKVLFALLVGLALTTVGCGDDGASNNADQPKPLRPGTYNAARHASIGISLTAGFMNNSFYDDVAGGARFSYDAQLSRAVFGAAADTLYRYPIIANPGLGGALFDTTVAGNVRLVSNRVELLGVVAGSPSTNINLNTANPVPTNATLARPYNNLGIPGSLAQDQLNNRFDTLPSPFFRSIFRQSAFGATGVRQAINLLPRDTTAKLITLWTGPNEVLGYVTSGGATSLYPYPLFQSQYDTILAQLRAAHPTAKIIVMNIPNVASIPFATFLGNNARAVATARGLNRVCYMRGNTLDSISTGEIGDVTRFMYLLPGGVGVTGIGSATAGSSGILWRSLLATINNTRLLSRQTALTIAELAGVSGIPTLDTTAIVGSARNPIPNQYVLDQAEIATANSAVNQFNGWINSKASAANNIFLVDVNAVFTSIVTQNGITSPDGELLKADFLTGGIFTLDGVHPGPKGHALVANLMIPIIEQQFGASIPAIKTRTLPDGLFRPTGGRPAGGNGNAFDAKFLEQFSPQTLQSTLQAVGAHY